MHGAGARTSDLTMTERHLDWDLESMTRSDNTQEKLLSKIMHVRLLSRTGLLISTAAKA
jgi:hypothetical protein